MWKLLMAMVYRYFKKEVICSINREENTSDMCNVPVHRSNQELAKLVDYSTHPDPEIKNINGGKSLLILDDIPISLDLYGADFRAIARKHAEEDIDPEKDFKQIVCVGTRAGCIAYKAIVIDKQKIDYAILDITLGYIILLDNEAAEYLELDGIDIAIELLKINPETKILFVTAHTMDIRNEDMTYYIVKFETETGRKMSPMYYANKNSEDRPEKIYNFLYGEQRDIY